MMPVIGLYAFTIIKKTNMMAPNTMPMIHANLFCCAPTYSGVWFRTIKRAMIKVGENFGLIKTRMIKSVTKIVIPYLISKKSALNKMNINDVYMSKNNIPAAALISLSFKTGILYPSTSSPNCINFFIVRFF